MKGILVQLQSKGAEDIHLTCYQNALSVYGQSGQFNEEDWKQNLVIDTADKHEGNTVLRGQETQQKSFKNN